MSVGEKRGSRERRMRDGKIETAHMKKYWKIQAGGCCLRVDGADNSLNVSRPEAWLIDRLCIISSCIIQTHLRTETRGCIVLHLLPFCSLVVQAEERHGGNLQLAPTRTTANNAPCQSVCTLARRERHSCARMSCFYRALWPPEFGLE